VDVDRDINFKMLGFTTFRPFVLSYIQLISAIENKRKKEGQLL
jgi:hypothetical protein